MAPVFQYRHELSAPARWGHNYSEEFPFDWLECDDALAPVGGELSLRAGSVAAGEDAINLYFTSVTSTGTSVRLARYTDFNDVCEISDDSNALDPNVVRYGEVAANVTTTPASARLPWFQTGSRPTAMKATRAGSCSHLPATPMHRCPLSCARPTA